MEEIVNIAEVEKQYQDEWLLFEVLESDSFERPVKGRLLCHSKSRQDIHEVVMKERSRIRHFRIAFAGDPVPPGIAVVL